MRSTSTPIVWRRLVNDTSTPPLSAMSTTRLPWPSFTPVVLQKVSGGRKVGTGTRRGMRFAASRLASAGCAGWTKGVEGDAACIAWAGFFSGDGSGCQERRSVVSELDHVSQGGEVPQLHGLIAWDV